MSVLNENEVKKSLMQQKKYSDDLDLALRRIEQHPSCRFGRGAMRQYRDGYWPAMDADVFRHFVLETPEQAERRGKVRITSLRLRSVMEPIKQKTAHPVDQWDASPNILVTRNGTLDLESLTLREHSPEDYALSALDLLEGLRRLRTHGRFRIPSTVQEASQMFQQACDIPGQFLAEHCERGDDYRISGQALYNAYRDWCLDRGYQPMSSTSVAKHWTRLGLMRYRANGHIYYRGVRLKTEA